MFYTFLAFFKMVLPAINAGNSLKQSILHESTNWGAIFTFPIGDGTAILR